MTNGTITVRNSYNPDGARIAKIVNRSNGSETHRYTYNGGKLVYDIIRINKEGTISNLTILMSYDESGRPFIGAEAFSFGVIFIGNDVDSISTVQHEYGHSIHFDMIGPLSYLRTVAIPSLIDYWTGTSYEEYYSEPQEYIADILGNVDRDYNGTAYPYTITDKEAFWYFLFTMIF